MGHKTTSGKSVQTYDAESTQEQPLTTPHGSAFESASNSSGAEAATAESQTIATAPGRPEDDLSSVPATDALPPERDSDTLTPLAPDAPYVYGGLDDKTFHSTLSHFVKQAQGQYADFGLTLYYRVLPGLQDAQRRFREHEHDPEYRLEGCSGVEEYVKKLGLKPARVRKWKQRDKERQFMRKLKLLSGIEICPDCGQEKGHARSCPHYVQPPPPPPENETEAALLAEQCLRMTKTLLDPSVEPFTERVNRVIRMAESVQEAAARGRYDSADFSEHANGSADFALRNYVGHLAGKTAYSGDSPVPPTPAPPSVVQAIETKLSIANRIVDTILASDAFDDEGDLRTLALAYRTAALDSETMNIPGRYELAPLLEPTSDNSAAEVKAALSLPSEPLPDQQGPYTPPQSSTEDRVGSRAKTTPTVWDCHAGKDCPSDAIYVGCRVRDRKGGVIREGSIFGNGSNPLVSHRGALKSESEFRAYALEKLKDPVFRQQAQQLKGKDLLCWCAQEGKRRAEFCHARVWLELINNSNEESTRAELTTERRQDFDWGSYDPPYLSKEEADALLEMAKPQPRYRPVIKRSGYPLRRCAGPCWSVRDRDEEDSVGMVPLTEAPPEIISLQRKLSDLAGKEVNYFSLQVYENEKDHIGFHQHREDKCRDARVYIISLGERRSFCVHKLCPECLLCDNCNRRRCHPDGPPCSNRAKCKAAKKHRKTCAVRKSTRTVLLPAHGSLIALTSEANDWYEHAVLDDKEPKALRISINTKCIPAEDAAAGYVPRELRIAGGFSQDQAHAREDARQSGDGAVGGEPKNEQKGPNCSKIVYESIPGGPKVLEVAITGEFLSDPPKLKYYVCDGDQKYPDSTLHSAKAACDKMLEEQGQGAAGLVDKAAQEVNPEEFDEKLSPEEQQQIDILSAEEIEQIVETELMPLDPDDDGYDAAEGVFRPENEHWRKLVKDGSLKERTLVPVHSRINTFSTPKDT
jgi:hypothetical protein